MLAGRLLLKFHSKDETTGHKNNVICFENLLYLIVFFKSMLHPRFQFSHCFLTPPLQVHVLGFNPQEPTKCTVYVQEN